MSQQRQKIGCIENKYLQLEISKTDSDYIYFLIDKLNNTVMADMDYHYSLVKTDGSICNELEERKIVQQGNRINVFGKFRGIDIEFEQVFETSPDGRWLDESITLQNSGNAVLVLRDIKFGFNKMLLMQFMGWSEKMDTYKLMSIPTRRFFHQNIDRRREEFTANDLVYEGHVEWGSPPNFPGYAAEGWIWTGLGGGLLFCKYNLLQIEFAGISRKTTQLPGRGCEDVSFVYGGITIFKGNPEKGLVYGPGASYRFGDTRYTAYQGGFEEAYYLYRDHLEAKGHTIPKNYDPPVHWNELYNLGWFAEIEHNGFFSENNPNLQLYTLEDLYREAQYAKDAGAESLYLDPGWDIYPGSSIWDEKRLGKFKDFADLIHTKYGLKVALHLMTLFASDSESEAHYCRNADGSRSLEKGLKLYRACTNESWVKEKTDRLLKLVDEGVDFFMFDFLTYGNLDGTGCMDLTHGHEVPMLRQTHAENIMKVIHNVKKLNPHVLIEAHDRTVHPMYFQHGGPDSFDENWGCEYMWNSLLDLLSGKALSLYEYNMACSIPLYLHINEHCDNDNMLSLWWYISATKHLGIGGLHADEPKFKLVQSAMTLYHSKKIYFTNGTFFGLAYDEHLHVHPKDSTAVLCLYNLASVQTEKNIVIPCARYGLRIKELQAFNGLGAVVSVKMKKAGDFLHIRTKVNPLSVVIVSLS
jgi:hypothetical protein